LKVGTTHSPEARVEVVIFSRISRAASALLPSSMSHRLGAPRLGRNNPAVTARRRA
jgi:hypothetical protein